MHCVMRWSQPPPSTGVSRTLTELLLVCTRDLAIPVQRSNQLSYEALTLRAGHLCVDHRSYVTAMIIAHLISNPQFNI